MAITKTEKIPVRIVQTQDSHGNKRVGVMLDVGYYLDSKVNPDEKVKQFKDLYFQTLEKAKKFMPKKGKRLKTIQYWRLSKTLRDFNSSIENEFFITNYSAALQRDFKLTDSDVGIIFQFGKYFKEDEILDEVSMSHYFELTLKKKQLSKKGIFEQEKQNLIKMGRGDKLPGHKEYREYLKSILKNIA